MKKRILSIVLAVMMIISAIPFSGLIAMADDAELTLAEKYPGVDTTRTSQPSATSVFPGNHDPEILWAPDSNGEYWYWDFCTGSYDVRKSKDLVTWSSATRFFTDLADRPPLPDSAVGYSNWWAPFVLDNSEKDGYYYLYYCHSSLYTRTSNLGVFRIHKDQGLDGRWEYCNLLVTTRSTDADGNDVYGFNGIDPMVTYDQEGRLWMTYGSFFHGIALVELEADDPTKIKGLADGETLTGTPADNTEEHPVYTLVRRDERQYIRDDKNVCGVEGPTIIYNPDTEYYYLCVSYDDLNDQYNTRIGRSKTITGPYLDYNGKSLVHYETWDSETRGEVGVKIIGPYTYDNDNHRGWVGTGHCTFFQAQDGEWYIGHNSRLGTSTGTALLNVRRVIWSDDGWPMLSSEMTAGENIQNLEVPEKVDVSGNSGVSWEIIRLERIIQGKALQQFTSTKYIFNADGTINNGGTWAYSNPNEETRTADVTFNLDNGVGDIKGKVYYGWDNENWKEALLFVGMTEDGTVYWGKKGLTAEEVYEKAVAQLSTIITDGQATKKGITLPTNVEGYEITWTSDSPEWMDNTGAVLQRPEEGAGAKEVILTASINDGDATAQFKVYIMEAGDLLAHYTFDNADDLTASTNEVNALTNYGATAAAGLFGGAAYLDGNNSYMQFPAGLTSQEEFTFAGWVNITDNRQWARILDLGGGQGNTLFLTNRNASSALVVDYNVRNNYTNFTATSLAVNGWNHIALTVDASAVKLYINGKASGSMNANGRKLTSLDGNNSFLGKSQYSDPYFNGYYDEVYLYSIALSEEEIAKLAQLPEGDAADLDKEALANIIKNNQTISADMDLPAEGPFGTPITWTSNNEEILTKEGKLLKRPEADTEPYEITLTAAIDDVTATFTVFVQPLPFKGLLAHYTFDDAENLVKDESGRGNDLINNGAVAADGLFGSAAYLAGNEEFLQFPVGMTSEDNFTLAMWFNVETNTAWTRIFDLGGGQGNCMFLTNNDLDNHETNVEDPNYLHLDLNVSNNYDYIRTTPAEVGEWAHVAVTVDDSNYYLYVNGELVGTQSLGSRKLSSLNGRNSFLGKSQYDDPTFNGYYDDVRFYNVTLSAEEIAALAVAPEEGPAAAADKDTYLVNENITITATTSTDVEKVAIYNESGKGVTRKSTTYEDTADGRVWTIVTSVATKGDRVLTVKSVADGQAEEIGTVSFKVVKVIPPVSEDVVPAIISVEAPETAQAKQAFTFTVKASKAITNIGLFNESGAGISTSKSYVDEGDVRIWTVNTNVSSRGARVLTVKAATEGSNWLDVATVFNITLTK